MIQRAASLFDGNGDSLFWLRMRQEVTLRNMRAMRGEIDKLSPKPKVGTIPRTATFSVLTAQDYQKTHVYFDLMFSKHYFWYRGFDGMYGSIARWCEPSASGILGSARKSVLPTGRAADDQARRRR